MRLLRQEADGEFSLVEFYGTNIPLYAVLSHTWGADEDEVSFKNMIKGRGKDKAGYKKIRFCAEQAANDGLQYFWVDTCNIDKSSSAELAEAINSMFQWYQKSTKCYVYLADVSAGSVEDRFGVNGWEADFKESRWFTRGWTLQELLAPTSVVFFDAEGKRLGSKHSLDDVICKVTGIPIRALHGSSLADFSIEERLSWAVNRQTKREEDAAYSLLGLFDLHMPLIYGEGRHKAFNRLHREIASSSEGTPHSMNMKPSNYRLVPPMTEARAVSVPPDPKQSPIIHGQIWLPKNKQSTRGNESRNEQIADIVQRGIIAEYEAEQASKAEKEREEHIRLVVAGKGKSTERGIKQKEREKKEKEELIMEIRLEEAKRREEEKKEYERFLAQQKKKNQAEAEAREAWFREKMRERLMRSGFQNHQIEEIMDPQDDSLPGRGTASQLGHAPPQSQLVDQMLQSVKHSTSDVKSRMYWDEAMAKHLQSSSRYEQVAVLLVNWEDELEQVTKETQELAAVFREHFGFRTVAVQLDAYSKPQHQINRHLSTFLEKHDGPSNLVLIYYAGNSLDRGDSGGLQLISRRPSQNAARIHWSKVEETLRSEEVEGDVLAVLDAYFPHRMSISVPNESTTTFEMLVAAGSRPKSFTRALIDSLIQFATSSRPLERSFTTSDLLQRIVDNGGQARGFGGGPEIRLAPLSTKRPPSLRYLTLSFGLQHSNLSREQIDYLTEALSKLVLKNGPVKIDSIGWIELKRAAASALFWAAVVMLAIVRWKKIGKKRRALTSPRIPKGATFGAPKFPPGAKFRTPTFPWRDD